MKLMKFFLTGNFPVLRSSQTAPRFLRALVNAISTSSVIPVPNNRITIWIPTRISGTPFSAYSVCLSDVSILKPRILISDCE